jgi:quercetin dioxygenase-like cupin family protein
VEATVLRIFLRGHWLGVALLASPITLLAQRDSATTRIVPLWRDGQLVTTVSGNPRVPGAPYVIRIWNFDNQIVLPHTHPEDEHVVVVQGTWYLAEGERFDRTRLRPLAVGDYALVPRGQAHFAWSKGMTVIQVHGIGPFRVDFVDSVFVLTGTGATVRFRNSVRPLTASEVAARFRYRLGDTLATSNTWGIVREAVVATANAVAQYIIEQPGELPSLHDETELRPRSRKGGGP